MQNRNNDPIKSSGKEPSIPRIARIVIPVGTAARVHANDIIMVARVTPEGAKQMKEALHKASN